MVFSILYNFEQGSSAFSDYAILLIIILRALLFLMLFLQVLVPGKDLREYRREIFSPVFQNKVFREFPLQFRKQAV